SGASRPNPNPNLRQGVHLGPAAPGNNNNNNATTTNPDPPAPTPVPGPGPAPQGYLDAVLHEFRRFFSDPAITMADLGRAHCHFMRLRLEWNDCVHVALEVFWAADEAAQFSRLMIQ
ncbi:hypothetical protein EKO27_g10743, partial [Xylaria grammica]